MTMLIAWTGIDTHGISSVYMASDSRITWPNSRYDYAKKIFSFKDSPDIIGYCGDVLFPSIVLNQIVEIADQGLLFEIDMEPQDKFDRICSRIKFAFDNYPYKKREFYNGYFEMVYLSRSNKDNKNFSIHTLRFENDKLQGSGGSILKSVKESKNITFPDKDKETGLPIKSNLLVSLGSGKKEFDTNFDERYAKSNNKETSRNIFHCFCDTLINTKEPTCGGAPQVSGIYRKPESSAFSYGIVFQGKRYYLGTKIDDSVNYDTIEWRNVYFEIVDAINKNKKKEAQSQPDLLKRY